MLDIPERSSSANLMIFFLVITGALFLATTFNYGGWRSRLLFGVGTLISLCVTLWFGREVLANFLAGKSP